MRRSAAVIAVLLLAALAAITAAPASADGRGFPRVKLVECRTSAAQAERGAAFQGRMRAVEGTERMQMRFTLQARDATRPRWHSQVAPGLGVWRTSDAGVTAYEFVQRVANLIVPGNYRVLVRYRWRDGDDAVIARARRLSATCAQPDLRPNLVALTFGAAAGSRQGTVLYRAVVRNRGRAAAGPFDSVLTVNGVAQPPATVAGLAPGQRTTLQVEAPRCQPGTSLVFVLDSRGQVEERNELDNQYTRPCPAGGVFGG